MSVSFIRIKAGAYRNFDASGQVFELVEQFKMTGKGGYVTVKNGGKFPGFPDEIRVKVDSMTDPSLSNIPSSLFRDSACFFSFALVSRIFIFVLLRVLAIFGGGISNKSIKACST